jgi:hypothetical protein
MQSLRATLRIHVVVLAVLLCLTLAFVAITTDEGLIARLFFGLFCSVIAGVVLVVYRKESAIAEDHVIVSGTVTEVKLGHRGRRNIRYHFVALDGLQYGGESDWGVVKPISVGADLLVLYKPLDPAVNQPLTRFWLYSFHAYAS